MFQYSSMYKKYETVTGQEWKWSNDTLGVLRTLPKVSLADNYFVTGEMDKVRDWCEERFGDNWLYDWNDFYFKYEKDAVLFALKWL